MKKVEMNHKTLYISNYFKTIEVPLKEIESVSGSLFFSLEFVWITLSKRSKFGRRIIFAGEMRLNSCFSLHPIVYELRDLAKRAKYFD